MEANRNEAQRCVDLACGALKENNHVRAFKFLEKAIKLYPTINIEALKVRMEKMKMKEPESSTTATDDGYGHYDQYEPDSELRNRKENFHSSHSQPTMHEADLTQTGQDSSSAQAPESKRARSKSATRSEPSNYTNEEVAIVERIRHCKDYYEILNLKKNASESDMKREYRKLALQLHPDKCKAPGATEAFKALGNAYAVLTSKEKRSQYDLYGADGPKRRNNGEEFYEYDYGRGFEADFSADEIFNMFFGGGYPNGNLNRHSRTHFFRNTSSHHQEQSAYAPLLQLLPLLAVLVLGLFAQIMVGEPPFSLNPEGKYTKERFTADLHIPYYVKPDFLSSYRGKINQIERQVEDEYISQLRMNCYRERSQKETMTWRARTFGDSEMYNRAQRMATPSCDRLHQIYT